MRMGRIRIPDSKWKMEEPQTLAGHGLARIFHSESVIFNRSFHTLNAHPTMAEQDTPSTGGEVTVSLAYHIVTEREVDGLDTSACRWASTLAGSLDHLADRAGVLPISAFFSEDWAAPEVYGAIFEAEGIGIPRDGLPATRWFSAEEGLASIRPMLSALAAHPTVVPDGTALIAGLREFESEDVKDSDRRFKIED